MKLIATVKDSTLLIHCGNDIEKHSYIIDLPLESLPHELIDHLRNRYVGDVGFLTISFSILEEHIHEELKNYNDKKYMESIK